MKWEVGGPELAVIIITCLFSAILCICCIKIGYQHFAPFIAPLHLAVASLDVPCSLPFNRLWCLIMIERLK
jgi:CHASE2 domain-containing sensor protein